MTTIAYILAGVFGVGVLALSTAFMASIEGWESKAIAACFFIPIVPLVIAVPFLFIGYINSPVLATLHRGEWFCTDSRTVTSMVMVGKVMVPQVRRVCVEYRRAD